VGYASFDHDFQELGVAASSGVLDPVLKIKRIESLMIDMLMSIFEIQQISIDFKNFIVLFIVQ